MSRRLREPATAGMASARAQELPRLIHPLTPLLAFVAPLLFLAWVLPESSYELLYRTPKYVDAAFVLSALFVYVGLALGMLLPDRTGSAAAPPSDRILVLCERLVVPTFWLTIVAYLVWITAAAINAGGVAALGIEIVDVVLGRGGSDELKNEIFTPLPGITTLTQLGILYVTVEVVLWVSQRSSRRAAAWRFAVIGAFVLFAAGEYFRSWTNFYAEVYHGPYLRFALERVTGYYAVSLNNAALLQQFAQAQPLHATLVTLRELPLGAGAAFESGYSELFALAPGERSHALLEEHGNVELNNVALVGWLQSDFTAWGAPLVAFLFGAVTISLYRGFLHGSVLGVLLYPSWLVGVLELPRIYYWTDPRYFPVLLVVLLAAWPLVGWRVRHRHSTAHSPPVETIPGQGAPLRRTIT